MNILNKIEVNIDKLNKRLDDSTCLFYPTSVFLVMSNDTGKAIMDEIDAGLEWFDSKDNLSSYEGHPIYIDEKLALGEVKVLIDSDQVLGLGRIN